MKSLESHTAESATALPRRPVNKNAVYRAANVLLQQGIHPKIKELQLYFKERGQSPSNSTLSDAMQTFFIDLAKDRGSELMSDLDLLESDSYKASPDDPKSGYFSEETKKALLDALLQIKADMFREIDQRRQVLEDEQSRFFKGYESRTAHIIEKSELLQAKLNTSNEQVADLIRSDMELRGVIQDYKESARETLEEGSKRDQLNQDVILGLRDEVKTLKDSLEQLTDQTGYVALLETKLIDAESLCDALDARFKTLQDTNRATLKINTDLNNEYQSTVEKLESAQDRVLTLKTAIKDKDGIISGLSEKNTRLTVKLEYSQEFVDELKKTLSALQMPFSLEAQTDGVDSGKV